MSFTAEQFGFNKEVNKFEVSGAVPFPYGVGIEVELEFEGRVPPNSLNGKSLKYWKTVGDNSLNDGIEYVTVGPLVSGSIVKALAELNASLKEHGAKPTFSERTSVHVHIDARDMSKEQISNLILLYLVFEKILFKFCGEDRAKNVFCMSAMDSDGIVQAIAKFFNYANGEDAAYTLRDFARYSSLNLNSLTKFGSIEIRAHRGEHKVRQLTNWVNILLSLKHYVMQNDEVLHTLPETISEMGPAEFMASVFGKYNKHLTYEGHEHDVIDGVRVAQNVLYSKNFEAIEDEMRKKNDGSKNSPLFLKYMERKYPALFKEKEGLKDIKKTVRGKEDNYRVDHNNHKVTTKKGNTYHIHHDEAGWFFVNSAKTKVLLSSMYQEHFDSAEAQGVRREEAERPRPRGRTPRSVYADVARRMETPITPVGGGNTFTEARLDELYTNLTAEEA